MSDFEDLNIENCTLDVLNDYCEPLEDYVSRIESHLVVNHFEGILIFISIVVFVIGIVGNVLVCFAVLRNAYMKTVTNAFLVNLAVADFFVIFLCMPPTIVEDIRETWYFGRPACKIAKYFQHVSVTVSILTLTVISVERWYAICRPLSFKSTMRRALILIAVIWIVALTLGIAQAVDMDTHHYEKLPPDTLLFTECKSSWEPRTVLVIKYFDMCVLFLVPFLWMAVAYAMISYNLWFTNIPGQVASGSQPGRRPTASENQLKSRRRAAMMLIAIVLMFFFCYLPVHLIRIVRSALSKEYFENHHLLSQAVLKFGKFSHWLCFFNSAVNPVIYNFMSFKFRREFRRACIWCCRKQATNNYNQAWLSRSQGNAQHLALTHRGAQIRAVT